MHPELMTYLADEHCRDIEARVRGRRGPAASAGIAARPPRVPRAGRTAHLRLPAFRLTWSRTTLAAEADRRRGRSVVIVISATRVL